MGIKVLEVAFQLETEIRHGKVSFEQVPKLVVQEVDVQKSLNLNRKLRQNSVAAKVNGYVLVIAPLVVKVLNHLLALVLIDVLLSIVMS
jgi:hypothetical protein